MQMRVVGIDYINRQVMVAPAEHVTIPGDLEVGYEFELDIPPPDDHPDWKVITEDGITVRRCFSDREPFEVGWSMEWGGKPWYLVRRFRTKEEALKAAGVDG